MTNQLKLIVSFVSQKGGVGKSSMARAAAVQLSRLGESVRIADLDTQQQTCLMWNRDRQARPKSQKKEVQVDVRCYETCREALAEAHDVKILIIDGPARATADTLAIAGVSDLVVQPSSGTKDDYLPAASLFSVLEDEGIAKEKMIIALSKITAATEERDARAFFKNQGYTVLDGCIRMLRTYQTAQNEGLTFLETEYERMNEDTEYIMIDLIRHVNKLMEQEQPAKPNRRKATTQKKKRSAA